MNSRGHGDSSSLIGFSSALPARRMNAAADGDIDGDEDRRSEGDGGQVTGFKRRVSHAEVLADAPEANAAPPVAKRPHFLNLSDELCWASDGVFTSVYASIVEHLLLAATQDAGPSATVREPAVVVLAPTKADAEAVTDCITELAQESGKAVSCTILTGAASRLAAQREALQQGVDIVAGSPLRMVELMATGCLRLKAVRAVLVVEADEMLTYGYADATRQVLDSIPVLKALRVASASAAGGPSKSMPSKTVRTVICCRKLDPWVKLLARAYVVDAEAQFWDRAATAGKEVRGLSSQLTASLSIRYL